MFPEYLLTSGAEIPLVKSWPRLYVLLFIEVLKPLKEESICKFDPVDGVITRVPPVEGLLVNSSCS